MGQNVTFAANGGSAGGYLGSPSAGRGPGVLVIQEWWGLIDQIKGVADMLAREGFNALAPDFYHGRVAQIGEPDKAGKLMMELRLDQAAKDARGAAQYLGRHPATASTKVGVIGFCMGGMLALLAGTVAPDEIGAVVDCYGVPPQQPPDYARLSGPVLGIFGGKDEAYANTDHIATLERRLREAGVAFTKHVYPQADHAFLNEQRLDIYRADDAKDAWTKILAFLRSSVS